MSTKFIHRGRGEAGARQVGRVVAGEVEGEKADLLRSTPAGEEVQLVGEDGPLSVAPYCQILETGERRIVMITRQALALPVHEGRAEELVRARLAMLLTMPPAKLLCRTSGAPSTRNSGIASREMARAPTACLDA